VNSYGGKKYLVMSKAMRRQLNAMPSRQGHTPSTSTGAASAQAGMVRIQRGCETRYVWPVHLPGWLAIGWQVGSGEDSAVTTPPTPVVVTPDPEAPSRDVRVNTRVDTPDQGQDRVITLPPAWTERHSDDVLKSSTRTSFPPSAAWPSMPSPQLSDSARSPTWR
jgi:hypothetical protein